MALQIKLVDSNEQADILGVLIAEIDLDAQLSNLPLQPVYLDQMITDCKFKGAKSSTLCVPLSDSNYKYLVLSGLGKAKNDEPYIENLRRAIAEIMRVCER